MPESDRVRISVFDDYVIILLKGKLTDRILIHLKISWHFFHEFYTELQQLHHQKERKNIIPLFLFNLSTIYDCKIINLRN